MKENHIIKSKKLHLLCVSFLGLFLELALIRYINSTVQIVAYFNNFLILSAFLGLGFGSLFVRYRLNLFRFFPYIALGVIGLMTYLDRFGYQGQNTDLIYWFLPVSGNQPSMPVALAITLVFFANFLFFIPLGERLGLCLSLFENRLLAYSLDLGGSILGVAGFACMSWLQTTPITWFSFAGLLAFILLAEQYHRRSFFTQGVPALLALALAAASTMIPPQGQWSPYYKITYSPYYLTNAGATDFIGYSIAVDKLRIQDALNFSPALDKSNFYVWLDYYRLPYHFREPGRVLILGGGSGNDAAIALREGAEKVDIVEIDPVIGRFGYSLHPHQPYKDAKTRLITDDARAYLRRSSETYDLIIMNALDSHHQAPGLSTLRLESYMYTVESFRDVQRLMKPETLFVVHLSSTRAWMGERLFWTLTEAFGKKPRLFMTAGSPFMSIAFSYGPDEVLSNDRFPGQGGLTELPTLTASTAVTLATDDWPHLYLPDRQVPGVYLLVLGIIVILTFTAFRAAGSISVTKNLQMFLLGAGFMLLETRSITKAAVLFGATWIVNAIVISGILVVIFAGNLLVMRNRCPHKYVAYAGLFLSLLLGYLVEVNFILDYSFWMRVVFAGFWLGFPIFFASLVFSTAFKNVSDVAGAFGSNLLGVVIGGALEYSSMILGLNALYLLAIALYAMAAVTSLQKAPPPAQ